MTASAPASSVTRDLSLVAALVTMVFWASAFVGIRAVGDTFSPGSMALGRLLVGALTLTVFVAWQRARSGPSGPLPRGRTLAFIVGYGVLWFGGYNVALNAGEQQVDAGTAALLVTTAPILVAVMAGLFMGEGFPRQLVVGITIAFGGVALIAVGSRSGSDPSTDLAGVALCGLAAVLYALGVVLQKNALRTAGALPATWLGCLVGVATCLPFTPQLLDELGDAPADAILGVAYLGVFPTAVAFTTWAYALSRIGAGPAAATSYLVPAMAIGMSWSLLGETPTALGLLGGAICLAGVGVTRLRRRPARTVTEPEPACVS
jgi:drug/metabolite transporter (DMT)-like permease